MVIRRALLALSGYNFRALIAFLRVCRTYNVPIYIIAKDKSDPIFSTMYAGQVVFVRESSDLSCLPEICQNLMSQYHLDEAVFLPSTEYLNRYLQANRHIFHKLRIKIPLIPPPLYDRLSDKSSFRDMCIEYGLPTTKVYSTLDSIEYPCVLKPHTYWSYSGKPIVILNSGQIPRDFSKEWFIEQYIPGDSYYLLYYFRNDGTYVAYSQKNLIQQNGGGSMLCACQSTLHHHPICRQYAEMFISERVTGLIMVEVKEHNGKYIMIEANPRLWGPSQFFVDAGIPFFEEFLFDCGFNIKNNISLTEPSEPIYYFWEGGFSKERHDEKYYSMGRAVLSQKLSILRKYDVFNRPDTLNLYTTES